jgi:putative copper export protein
MTMIGISFAFHLIGINLWVGAAFLLSLAVIPALGALEPDAQLEFLKRFTRHYLPWFILGGLTVGVTGWFQTFDMLKDLNLPAAYAKHSAIVLLILVSVVLYLFLARRLSKPIPDRQKFWNWFVTLAWIQSVLGVIILFLTGWLTE